MAKEDQDEVVQLTEELRKQVETVKGIAEDVIGKVKAGDNVSQDAKTTADKALTELNTLRAQVEEVVAKAARAAQFTQEAIATFGEQFVNSDSFKALSESASQRGRAELTLKNTFTLATAAGVGNAGLTVQTTRIPGLVADPEQRMTVRDLITPGRMDGNALEYVKETGFTNNAAPVAEAAKKPQSTAQFELVTTTAKVIAHYTKASRQILSDSSMLQSYIDGRMRYGLALVEEQQLLNGDGTGQNLLGIVPQASAYVAPGGLVPTSGIDVMRLAMLQAVLAGFPATGHVLNPIDWTSMELLRTDKGEGQYVIGDPQGAVTPRLWNLPVVQTQAMAAGKFLSGAFKLGAQVFDRWQARVEVATENEDDFIKNLVTILAEERLALAVYRPETFVYGNVTVGP